MTYKVFFDSVSIGVLPLIFDARIEQLIPHRRSNMISLCRGKWNRPLSHCGYSFVSLGPAIPLQLCLGTVTRLAFTAKSR